MCCKEKIWYYVLQSTFIFTYICNTNNSVIKSSVLKKVLYIL